MRVTSGGGGSVAALQALGCRCECLGGTWEGGGNVETMDQKLITSLSFDFCVSCLSSQSSSELAWL